MPNTTILSAAVNANFTDIATGLSDCLTRDGQAGMTAAFKAIAGSLGAPGISFTSDATSGMYLPTTGEVGLVSKSLGLIVNSSIYQVASATVQSGGSGYVVGDVVQTAGGTSIGSISCLLKVATLSGSAIATVTVAYPGQFTVKPTNPVSQGSTDGSGTGATFNLTFAAQFASSVVTDEAGNYPWQRLGASSFVSGIMHRTNAYDYLTALITAGSGIAISHATNPVISATLNPTLVPNYISGLTLSTAGSSASFGIAVGVANDTTNATLMSLGSAYTKTTSSWAVGSGNGGLDTGAIANTTWYHVHLIERTDTGVVDVLFSLDPNNPTMPTNYTLHRRIGSLRTDGSAHWLAFTQTGDTFIWGTVAADVSNSTVVSALTNTALTVPSGVIVSALMRASLNATTGTSGKLVAISETDQAVSTNTNTNIQTGNNNLTAGQYEIVTNTASQIAVRFATNSAATYSIYTYGWKDTRGA